MSNPADRLAEAVERFAANYPWPPSCPEMAEMLSVLSAYRSAPAVDIEACARVMYRDGETPCSLRWDDLSDEARAGCLEHVREVLRVAGVSNE